MVVSNSSLRNQKKIGNSPQWMYTSFQESITSDTSLHNSLQGATITHVSTLVSFVWVHKTPLSKNTVNNVILCCYSISSSSCRF